MLLVLLEPLEPKVLPALGGIGVLKVHGDPWVSKDLVASKVIPERRVTLVLKVPKEPLEQLEPLEQPEPQALQELQEPPVLREKWEFKELQDLKVPRVLRAPKDPRVVQVSQTVSSKTLPTSSGLVDSSRRIRSPQAAPMAVPQLAVAAISFETTLRV